MKNVKLEHILISIHYGSTISEIIDALYDLKERYDDLVTCENESIAFEPKVEIKKSSDNGLMTSMEL